MWNWHGCQKRAQQTLFTLNHVYRAKNNVPKFLGPRNFSWSHAQFNYNEERSREWAAILKCTLKTASLYELRLNLGPLKCLQYLFYPNRAAFLGTRTIFTRARTTSPKVPARVKILVRHGWYGQVVYTANFIRAEPFLSGSHATFTRAVPKNFCSVNRA